MPRFTGPGIRPRRLPRVQSVDPLVAMSFGFFYVYEITLQPNTQVTDALALDTDADFLWQGISAVIGAGTNISVTFKDQSGMAFSNVPIMTTMMTPFAANGPFTYLPVWPAALFPAGGSIGMDWEYGAGGAPSAMTMLFRGAKVFSTQRT